MPGVAIKDIEGALVEKKDLNNTKLTISTFKYCEGINDAIEKQGSVKIGLNREKLAIKLHHLFHDIEWITVPLDIKNDYRLRADAIKKDEKELFEVVK